MDTIKIYYDMIKEKYGLEYESMNQSNEPVLEKDN